MGQCDHKRLMAGELAGVAEAAVANQSRTPDQVPAAEAARWRELIRALLSAKPPEGLKTAWVAMTEGRRVAEDDFALVRARCTARGWWDTGSKPKRPGPPVKAARP